MIDKIIAYEEGSLSEEDTIALFQTLIDTGQAWTLQGHYGRQAHALIEAGLCRPAPPAEEEPAFVAVGCLLLGPGGCDRRPAYSVSLPGQEAPVPGCRHHIASLDL